MIQKYLLKLGSIWLIVIVAYLIGLYTPLGIKWTQQLMVFILSPIRHLKYVYEFLLTSGSLLITLVLCLTPIVILVKLFSSRVFKEIYKPGQKPKK